MFPPASRRPCAKKSAVSSLSTRSHSDVVLWKACPPAHQEKHHSQPPLFTSLHSEPTHLWRMLSPPPLHSSLYTPWINNTCITYFYFNSAFNAISLIKLMLKLSALDLSTTLCNLTLLDLLTNRPQTVRIGSHTSSTLVLNSRAT